MKLSKPKQLFKGDKIATISLSHGWAGDPCTRWKYDLGVNRLNELGLTVIPAPNSLKGSEYLSKRPKARAEDVMWAFENKEIKAIIANMGGNDSISVIPFISNDSIKRNHKIFIGFSDIMNMHILCYKNGLSSFYGDNLLYPIAESQGWHLYSKKWFEKVLFNNSPIGLVEPSEEWTFESTDYKNPNYTRKFYKNNGYEVLQGKEKVRGRLFGGHTGMSELQNTPLHLTADDFNQKILFVEDIPEFFTPECAGKFFMWLGNIGGLQKLNGIIIGKLNENKSFIEHKNSILHVVSETFGLYDLPIMYGLNFGHSSPICVLPYGANAEINCDQNTFSILESGVN